VLALIFVNALPSAAASLEPGAAPEVIVSKETPEKLEPVAGASPAVVFVIRNAVASVLEIVKELK
jgi:hypothetical protein